MKEEPTASETLEEKVRVEVQKARELIESASLDKVLKILSDQIQRQHREWE